MREALIPVDDSKLVGHGWLGSITRASCSAIALRFRAGCIVPLYMVGVTMRPFRHGVEPTTPQLVWHLESPSLLSIITYWQVRRCLNLSRMHKRMMSDWKWRHACSAARCSWSGCRWVIAVSINAIFPRPASGVATQPLKELLKVRLLTVLNS